MTLFHWLKLKYIQIQFFGENKETRKNFVRRLDQIMIRLVNNFLKITLFHWLKFKYIQIQFFRK
jgi:hypothetical protein